MAPTIIIGMGPAGLIGLDLLTLTQTGAAAGLTPPVLAEIAQPFAVAAWGFGLWWAIAALIVIRRGYPQRPFALSAWAYTFPVGAWVVGGIVIGFEIDSLIVIAISLASAVALFAVWLWAAVRTLGGVRSGKIFEAA